jgi:hypothetical protein
MVVGAVDATIRFGLAIQNNQMIIANYGGGRNNRSLAPYVFEIKSIFIPEGRVEACFSLKIFSPVIYSLF